MRVIAETIDRHISTGKAFAAAPRGTSLQLYLILVFLLERTSPQVGRGTAAAETC